MKNKWSKSILFIFVLILGIIFYMSNAFTLSSKEKKSPKVKKVKPTPVVPVKLVGIYVKNAKLKPDQLSVIPPKKTEVYKEKITPLTAVECGRCHSYHFNIIKKSGGKHQLECTFCHKKFHAYNPIKKNWKELMPKCETCHLLFHGNKFSDCIKCHYNPHAPKLPMKITAEFTKICGDCHPKEMDETVKYHSKHTDIGCTYCHAKTHGCIPSCLDCHKPHIAGQTVEECFKCHAPHSPLNIPPFAKDTSNKVCSACHTTEFGKISTTKSKHGKVACVQCHPKHKYIPVCTECHPQPHSKAMLKKFPNCLQCHMDVHNLPVKIGGK